MPNMIYGTAWKKEETTRLVEEALLCGFKAVDTACQPKHYREDLVGLGLQNAFAKGINRDDILIQTKFTPISGQDKNNMPYFSSDDLQTQLEKSFIKSKENLKVDFIDSYLIHSPFNPIKGVLTALAPELNLVSKRNERCKLVNVKLTITVRVKFHHELNHIILINVCSHFDDGVIELSCVKVT